MKKILSIIAFAVLLCGCAGMFKANNQAVAKLNTQMSPEWLKANIIIGKTTKEEIQNMFGEPVFKNASSGSGLGAAFMPDEMWTYSVRFSSADMHGSANWTKAIVFSFKNGTVSDYNVSSTSF